jgi:hypothetical protein
MCSWEANAMNTASKNMQLVQGSAGVNSHEKIYPSIEFESDNEVLAAAHWHEIAE